MKKYMISGLLGLSLLGMLTGCGQNVPLVVNNMDKTNKCNAYNGQLLKVDEYITKVESMSAFHLEEAAAAIENPQISTSNNKKDMLKDASKRRTNILADMKTNGCESYKK